MGLDEYAETGSPVQARVSAEMLATIFTPYSPLHDGAVLIAGDQIRAAGAILPLTQTTVKDRSLGTRHRAALGLSEETDAVVIVVSEETSQVSVADGRPIGARSDARAASEHRGGGVPPDRADRLYRGQTGVAAGA